MLFKELLITIDGGEGWLRNCIRDRESGVTCGVVSEPRGQVSTRSLTSGSAASSLSLVCRWVGCEFSRV